MINTVVKDIYSQFSKKELQDIASELEVTYAREATTRTLAQVILKDLEENGIPEDLAEVSDNLYGLLVTAEFIDEEGNIIETENEPSGNAPEPAEILEIPDWICFSYAEPRDPACNKCKLYNPCWAKRIASRPPCFGLQYNAADPECMSCIEQPYCKKETESNG